MAGSTLTSSFINDARLCCGDAEGNAAEAIVLSGRGAFGDCIQRLEWLKENAGRAIQHAQFAIDRIKRSQEEHF